MPEISVQLKEIGSRLRDERERLGMNQSELGAVADIARNTQAEYENGKRACNLNYLLAIRELGIDPAYLIDGRRDITAISRDTAAFLDCVSSLTGPEKEALKTVALSMAGRSITPAPLNLPSTAALEDALTGFLGASPGLAGDELIHELATSLPTILRAAADEIDEGQLDQRDTAPSHQATGNGGNRAAQPGRRS